MKTLIHSCLVAAVAGALCLAFATDAAGRGTRTSVGYGGGNTVSRSAAHNGPGNTSSVSRNTSVNANRNVNVNRNTNVNVDRDVNVHVDNHWDDHYDHWDHPVAAAAAIGTAAAVTAAAIGSIAYSIPPSCVPVVVNGMTYQQCGSTWYQPQYAGASVQYIVVTAPR
jgi:hypothetical protein